MLKEEVKDDRHLAASIFRVTRPLAGLRDDLFSFESVSRPNFFLTVLNGRVQVQQLETIDSLEYVALLSASAHPPSRSSLLFRRAQLFDV